MTKAHAFWLFVHVWTPNNRIFFWKRYAKRRVVEEAYGVRPDRRLHALFGGL